jgi:hypothetical protein
MELRPDAADGRAAAAGSDVPRRSLPSHPKAPRPDHRREFCMKWTKPEFELVELCSEVTSYFHHR